MISSRLKHNGHLAKKLNDFRAATKTYCSIFVNGTKIPLILHVYPVDKRRQFIVNKINLLLISWKKATLFNNFLSLQFIKIMGNSPVPKNPTFHPENRLSTFEFSIGDYIKVIKTLHRNKGHGHDVISIRMIKLCASSI